jgi:hypothetical protein
VCVFARVGQSSGPTRGLERTKEARQVYAHVQYGQSIAMYKDDRRLSIHFALPIAGKQGRQQKSE